MKIIEQSVIPKSPAKKSEDGIVVTNNFIAVIDGSTSKTPYHHCPWMSNGRYAMRIISRYIRRMPADISCQQFCKGITRAIARHYWLRFPKKRMAEHPEERLTASAVIYSRLRRTADSDAKCGLWATAIVSSETSITTIPSPTNNSWPRCVPLR